MRTFFCHSNRLFIGETYIDIQSLSGFDLNKASNWANAIISGTIVTAIDASQVITYTYDCGNEYKETFIFVPAWSSFEYTVIFDANGGSVSQNSKTVKSDEVYGTLPAPNRTGYTFKGWHTAKTGGTKITADTKASLTKNQTLYAQWTANKYTVTYNANSGSVKTKSKSVTYASTYGALATPTRSGYKFKGWYTAKSGGNKITASSKVSIIKNQTLYARWTKVSVSKGKVSKLTNTSGKKGVIAIKKVSGTKGYQVEYATNKNFKNSKKKATAKTSLTLSSLTLSSLTLSSLTKGKTYYVRVRGYKLDSKGKKIYGSYSAAKKIKITK